MKKFIILGLVVLFTLLSAKLYKVKDPARFSSWVKIGGDFIPIWDGRSNLGHPFYWFDSSFVEHGWFKYIQIDSGGYLKLDSLDITTLTADTITTKQLTVEDTIFTDFIAADESTVVYLGADGLTETDSIQINEYVKGDLVATGAVKPAVVVFNIFNSDRRTNLTAAQTANTNTYFTIEATADTIIIDSIKVVTYTSHDDVYIDSMALEYGATKTGLLTTLIWSDGTDLGAGTSSTAPHTYGSLSAKMAWDWRPKFEMYVETAGAAGTGYLYTAILYCHYW